MAVEKCPVCNADYTDTDMIECKRCHKKVHYVCANHTEQVAIDPNWKCLACVNELMLLERNTRALGRLKVDVPIVSRSQLFPPLKPLKEQAKGAKSGVVPKGLNSAGRDLIELASQKEAKSTEDGAGAPEPKPVRNKPGSSSSSKRTKLSSTSSKARLAAAAARLRAIEAKEELAKRKAEMIKQQEALIREEEKLAEERLEAELEATQALDDSDSSSESVVSDVLGVDDLEKWLNDTQAHQANSSRRDAPYPDNFQPHTHPSRVPIFPEDARSHDQALRDPIVPPRVSPIGLRQEASKRNHELEPRGLPRESQDHVSFAKNRQEAHVPRQRPNVAETSREVAVPTMAQLTARSSMGRKLPDFNGKAGSWLIFYSSYCESTVACGFNNRENLIRLQEHLKDPARKMVAGLLNDPDNVKEIIDTLQMLYGRPERVIGDMIDRVQALPAPKEGKLEALVEYAVEVKNLSFNLKKMPNHRQNPILIEKVIEKLPPSIKLAWSERPVENYVAEIDVVEFADWLYKKAMNLCRSVPGLIGTGDDRNRRTHERVNVSQVSTGNKCIYCSKQCRSLSLCPEFTREPVQNRWTFAKNRKLCFRCLTDHNYKEPCTTPSLICFIPGCTKSHHPLLHGDQKPSENTRFRRNQMSQNSGSQQSGVGNSTGERPRVFSGNHHQAKQTTFFRYLPVEIRFKGRKVKTVAFMDEGSSATLLAEDVARQLELEGPTLPLCLKWTDGDHHKEDLNSKQANVIIRGLGLTKDHSLKVRTIDELDLPVQALNYDDEVQKYPYLANLPVQSYKGEKPGILIGMDNWDLALPMNYREGAKGQPIAVKCRLGWTVIKTKGSGENVRSFHICECHTEKRDDDLYDLVKGFYALDRAGLKGEEGMPLSRDEQRALEMMKNSIRKEGDRYRLGLLWKDENSTFPDSKPMAQIRLEWLERRLERSPELKEAMRKLISEYEEKGYVRKLTPEELEAQHQRVWNLPLFPVTNPNKPGKVRPVWDAKAVVGGVSLNSRLLTGPDLNTTLLEVLLRFRQYQYATTADIKEMFHRVLIDEEDQHAQRFLWRDCDTQRDPDVYVVQVMTFGATCSPSCAQFVKNENAEHNRQEFPEAAEAIINGHYVDDELKSFKTEEEAIKVSKDVVTVHAKAGFEIRNWRSNSKRLMEAMGETQVDDLPQDMDLSPDCVKEKVLGLWWKYQVDQFTFSLKFNKGNNETLQGKRCPTKREALKILMSIYDPLGLLANYLIYLKILIQDLWRLKLDWDDPIPEEQFQQFLKWVSLLPQIEQLGIPRCYLRDLENYDGANVQLHVFTDASEHACAAVAYLRIEREGHVRCSLVMAKTKVAPIKLTSVPRLELEAAVMGVRLGKTIKKALDIPLQSTHYWSDSSNVLRWLRKPEIRRLGKFVAFRVAEIQESSDPNRWRYVPTDENVADEGTKWVRPPTFDANSRWFTGPSFLYAPADDWPVDITRSIPEEEEVIAVLQVNEPLIDFSRFSNWQRVLGAVARILALKDALKQKSQAVQSGHPQEGGGRSPISIELDPCHYENAEIEIFKQVQSECYAREIRQLLDHDDPNKIATVSPTSPIFNLSPYLEKKDGLLRVRGRIDACVFAKFDTTRPVILPRSHHLTHLLVNFFHRKMLHANSEIVVNEMRQRFRIPQLRALVKEISRNCPLCKIRRAKPVDPEMGELPLARVAPYTDPFTYVGVDYFGPVYVAVKRSREKRWGVIYTCLTTRAVHIDLVDKLDTPTFLQSLRDFMLKRGVPREIYSDRGTNFVGAEKVLKEEAKNINRAEVAAHVARRGIKWKFNPPASPHMGGAWERLIRSLKKALYSVLPTRIPTEKIMRSCLFEAEHLLNQRPLTYVPIANENAEAITPNHWLIGSSSGVKTRGEFNDGGRYLLKCYLYSQQFREHLWKRWMREYLPDLTRRTKNYQPAEPLREGDVVIICDPALPADTWPKGRVLQVFPGKDGQVRAARIRTMDGELTRPATKLAKLDLAG